MSRQIKNISEVIAVCRGSFFAVAVFSALVNLLMLVPAFFMLNVYDKAVAHNSLPTLWVLTLVAVFLFVMMAAFDYMRARVLVYLSSRFDAVVNSSLFTETFENAVRVGPAAANTQPFTDFKNLRQFITGPGFLALCDIPWSPLYIIILFLFHPLLGWLGVISTFTILALALANQLTTTPLLKDANELNAANAARSMRTIRNAEVASSMGMLPRIRATWTAAEAKVSALQESASANSAMYSSLTKTLRQAIQSGAIAAGAYLVLKQEISPGMLIAGSILIGRALQPVELAIGAWRGFVDAVGQYSRVNSILNNAVDDVEQVELPPIQGTLVFASAAIKPHTAKTPTAFGVNAVIESGTACAVIGPSGSGKSTLVRGLLGLWPTVQGEIRIDGAEAHSYPKRVIGDQIGYLPQAIELMEGTVAENIARMGSVDSPEVIDAAKISGIHDFILTLPDGYNTVIEGIAHTLSPGQKQRIALARAIYGKPQIVVLDEPNSNLDQQGDEALRAAIQKLKERAATVLLVSHRPNLLPLTDKIILMDGGRMVEFAPTDDVLARMAVTETSSKRSRPASTVTVPIKS